MRKLVRRLNLQGCIVALAALAAASACDSTSPPKPVAIVFMGDANQSGTVAQILLPGPQIQIRDAQGNPLNGIAFTVTVAGGGTLTETPVKTTSSSTALGTWTLGQTAGLQSLTVESAGVPPLTITAAANPGPAATSSAGGAPTVSAGVAGAVSVSQPQIKILDAFGNVIPGVTIAALVIGGGSVQNSNPITNSAGIASVGVWTLGPVAGTQRVTLSAGGLVPPVVFTANVEAGPPAAFVAVGATSATGISGQNASIVPTVKLTDAYGNGVVGVAVTVAVGAQSGSVTAPSAVTNSSGVATAGAWTLGATAGTQTVTMSVAGFAPVVFAVTATLAAYYVDVRFVGAAPSDAVRAAVASAVTRLQRIITADLPNKSVFADANGCQPGAGTINEVVDDILVLAAALPIDGPGGILAQAGWCGLRSTAPFLPYVAAVTIDASDAADPQLAAIILHELFHALGFGTLWLPSAPWTQTLLVGKFTSNPYFTGPQALASYLAAGGTQTFGVPVEATGGNGTAWSHWRESVFHTELMTGYLHSVTPLSAISIGSLADLGYTVSLAEADPYVVSPPGQLRAGVADSPRQLIEPWIPRWLVDLSGPPLRPQPGFLPPPQVPREAPHDQR